MTNLTLNLLDIWVGDGAANNWDSTSANWINGGTKYAFQPGTARSSPIPAR